MTELFSGWLNIIGRILNSTHWDSGEVVVQLEITHHELVDCQLCGELSSEQEQRSIYYVVAHKHYS